MEVKNIFESGAVNCFQYCEVIQIVLFDKKNKEYWNYFTHVNFSEKYLEESGQEYLLPKPKTINKNFKLMIFKQVAVAKEIINVIDNAVESQKWILGEDEAKLDEVFLIDPRYVAETDPTGNLLPMNALSPLEWSFYGTNFSGNYYIVELFSAKKYLNSILSDADKHGIQKEINAAKLHFDIYSMSDRIGNIVCKIPSELIKHCPIKLSPKRGISGKFKLNENVERSIRCYLMIISVNDHMVIESKVVPFELSYEKAEFQYEIEPNRYKNFLSVIDQDTGIIYYSSEHDYSFGSDYHSTIMPPDYIIQSPSYREFKVNGVLNKCELVNLSGIGDISVETEIFEINQRQNKWKDREITESHYFRSFERGNEKEAINTIRDILNDKNLLWDLKEICLVDPYLCPQDILKTVLFCRKQGIFIKCLTDIGTINGNKETRIEVSEGEDRFTKTKCSYRNELKDSIPKETDIKLDYRTVRGIHGKPFHDRYLILKYGVNKCRVWSLGISVNSLGTSHHIVQIVELPVAVSDVFESIWNDTDYEECYIYSNLKRNSTSF